MKTVLQQCFVFALGAVSYCAIETWWRGYTHFSMGLAGGVCILIFYNMWQWFYTKPLILWGLVGGSIITGVELLFGVVFNLILGYHVWDYSGMPYHVMGQICPTFSVIWMMLSYPAIGMCGYLYICFHP